MKRPLAFVWFLGVAFAYVTATHYGADLAKSTFLALLALIYMFVRELNRLDERIDKAGRPERDENR